MFKKSQGTPIENRWCMASVKLIPDKKCRRKTMNYKSGPDTNDINSTNVTIENNNK